MGNISDKLVALGQSKAAIRQAIIDKGVDVPPDTIFSDYAVKISEIEQGGGSSSGSGSEWSQEYYESVFNSYQRPSDWLDIETLHPLLQGDQKFVGLMAVHEESGNFTTIQAITSSGQYRVDWGDGTTSDHDSSVIAYKTYDYDNISESTLCSRGYRQAIVTVIPISGDLLSVNLNNKHTQAGLPSGYSTKWLDIRMAGLEIDVLSFNTSLIRHYLFERFAFVGTHSITSMMAMFSSCSSLQTIPLLDTSSVSTMSYMFQGCTSLKTIPLLDASSVINIYYMFSGCNSLQTIPLLDTSSVSNMAYMFFGCNSLQTIPLLDISSVSNMTYMFSGCNLLQTIPLLDTSSVSNMTYMFYSCSSLQTIPLLDTSSVSNMTYMFQRCSSLQTIPLLDTSSVSNMIYMFSNCSSLQTIPLLDTSSVSNMMAMFQYCSSLQTIPLLDTSLVTSMDYMFSNCPSLQRNNMLGTKAPVSYTNCLLSKAALVIIFNNLATATGQTITITGNYGASLLTAADRLIATDKGWTIIG